MVPPGVKGRAVATLGKRGNSMEQLNSLFVNPAHVCKAEA